MTFGVIKSGSKAAIRAISLGRLVQDGYGPGHLVGLTLPDLWTLRARTNTWTAVLGWIRRRPCSPWLFCTLTDPPRRAPRQMVRRTLERFCAVFGTGCPRFSRWPECIPPAPRYTLREFLDRTTNQAVLGTPLPPRPDV